MPVFTANQAGFVSCGELFDSNSGKPFNKDGNRTYVKKFRVIVNHRRYAHTAYVCSHADLPRPYSMYISPLGDYTDPNCLLVDFDAAAEEGNGEFASWQCWIVTCTYSTQLPPGGPQTPEQQQQSENNPEYEPPTIHWESETVMRAFPFDLDGVMFANSAFVPYKPARMIEITRPVLVITRNELTFGPTKIDEWSNKYNGVPFLGRPVGGAKISAPSAETKDLGRHRYYRVTYRITLGAKLPMTRPVKVRKWNVLIEPAGGFITNNVTYTYENFVESLELDEGLMRLDNNADSPHFNQPVQITKAGKPVSQAQLLNGLGQKLDFNDNGVQPGMEVYNSFRVKEPSADFPSLLVGITIP